MSDDEELFDTRVLHELCSMMVHMLRFPIPTALPFPYSSSAAAAASTSRHPPPPLISAAHLSPAAFGCLFLVVAFALMLFGSVTFAIGLILAPWVVLFVLFFYVAGIVSNLSELARAIVYHHMAEDTEFEPWISLDMQLHEEQ